MAHSQVILLDKITTLGAEADIVKVRRGYARNFLIPHGKALEVTPSALRQVNHLKAKRAEREAREVTAAEELASKINKLSLDFVLETGETGKAFGSVTAKDIHDRLVKELGDVEIARHAITLDKAVKESGEQEIAVKLHADVTAKLKITITAPAPKVDPRREAAEAAEEAAERPRRKPKSE